MIASDVRSDWLSPKPLQTADPDELIKIKASFSK